MDDTTTPATAAVALDAAPSPHRRRRRLLLSGVVAAGLSLAGAEMATASSPVTDAVVGVAQAAGVDWSSMPEGYTVEDRAALEVLWNSDPVETKARAGQMLLDGQTPPVAPSGVPVTDSTP